MKRKCLDLYVFKIPDPDDYLSASDVKDVAEEVITPLSLPGVEGSPLDPGDIWLVVILACVNQTSIWETCKDTDGAPVTTLPSRGFTPSIVTGLSSSPTVCSDASP